MNITRQLRKLLTEPEIEAVEEGEQVIDEHDIESNEEALGEIEVEDEDTRLRKLQFENCIGDTSGLCVLQEEVEELSDLAAIASTKRCKDTIYLTMFLTSLIVLSSTMTFIIGRLPLQASIQHTDSWGNRCGYDNAGQSWSLNTSHSGMNMVRQRVTLFLSTTDTVNYLSKDTDNQYFARICVTYCPDVIMKCEELLHLYGYVGLDQDLMDRRICITKYDLILPYRRNYYQCEPLIVSLGSELDHDKVPEPEPTVLQQISKWVIKSTDESYKQRKLIYSFMMAAVVAAYTFAFLLFRFPSFSYYYFATLTLHSCALGGFICLHRLTVLDSHSEPDLRNGSLAHQIDSTYYTDITQLVEGNETWMADAKKLNLSVASEVKGTLDGKQDNNRPAYLSLGIASLVLGIIVIPGLSAIRKYNVDSATILFKALTAYLKRMPMMFLIPLVTGAVNLLMYYYWVMMLYYLYSTYDKHIDADGLQIIEQQYHPEMVALQILCIICLLWVGEFMYACEQFIMAGCTHEWYFTSQQKRKRITLPIWRTLKKLFGSSMGQIAMGSCTSLIAYPLRFVNFCFRGCECRRFDWDHIRYYTNDAYISVVVFGEGYAHACNRTLRLMNRHAPYAQDTKYIVAVYALLARVSVTILTTVVCLLVQEADWYGKVTSDTIPVVVIAYPCWFVSRSVLNVHEVSMETLIFCYCVDMERNNGLDLPYCSPKIMLDAMRRLKKRYNKFHNTELRQVNVDVDLEEVRKCCTCCTRKVSADSHDATSVALSDISVKTTSDSTPDGASDEATNVTDH